MAGIENSANERDRELAASINKELVEMPRSSFGRCCIFRVHEKFRRINECAYTPEMVSIGPFHHDKVSLQDMEYHKLLYMEAILVQTRNRVAKLEECVASIRDLQETARKCYSEPIEYDDDKFIRMMIVDGLFIIELFRRSCKEVQVDRADHIFSNKWVIPSLVRDLILLENQLPLAVLENLFTITRSNPSGKSLKELAICFFDPLIRREKKVLLNCFNREGKHLLDFLSKSFYESSTQTDGMFRGNAEGKHVPSVTELRKAGIKFRKHTDAGSFLDIEFSDGILLIPPLLVQDQTDTLLRNLIACEQHCDGQVSCMTSYASLMDSLIDSPSDVEILRRKGIITNWLGDDKKVSSLFNMLCHEVTLTNFHYANLCDELNGFYNKRWNKWFADLCEYFRTPWKAISIVVAALVVFFTAGQFLFAALSYFIPSKK